MTPAAHAQTLLQEWRLGNVLATDCPSRPILQHMTSRWGALVLIVLLTGTHRFSALRRQIGGISERMLAQTLQALEADGLVARHALDVVPPHVEYALTPLGREGAEKVLALTAWIEGRLPEIMGAKSAVAA